MLGCPGSSHETPGVPEKVLGEMLGDKEGVLGENICVGGILKCHSLTRRFVLCVNLRGVLLRMFEKFGKP